MNIKEKKNLTSSFKVLTAVFLFMSFSNVVVANDLILTLGGGKQPDSKQENKIVGLDINFFEYIRSNRQTMNIGVSYTQLKTNFDTDKKLWAISIYPQLTLFPSEDSWLSNQVLKTTTPYFFVRALGPTYLSNNTLGDRKQSKNLTFQAQVGLGILFKTKSSKENFLFISWKHFSNANLFSENDGFDSPIVIGFGLKF
jgi:hypothetical protein